MAVNAEVFCYGGERGAQGSGVRQLLVIALLGLIAARAAAQCGPDQSKPYPPGQTVCPTTAAAPPAGGASAAPTTSAALCDPCGASATYAEAIDTSGSVPKRTITTSGCPNHYSVCTGKVGVCAEIGAEGTATEARDQKKVEQIPANPVLASSVTDVECSMGPIGIALNGVSIYGGAVDQACKKVETDNDASEWTSFDMCSGHSQRTGDYHYHFPPSCLLAQAVAETPTRGNVAGHSPQIGWSFDGFPVYGPLYIGGQKVTGTDACGGKQEELAALDGFKYRYYFTGDVSNLYALPGHPKPVSADYPYAFKCFKGCTYAKLADGTCTGTPGVVSGYAAAAKTGYKTQFAAYSKTSAANWKGQTYTSAFIKDGKCASGSPTSGASSASPASGGASSIKASSVRSSVPSLMAVCFFTTMVCFFTTIVGAAMPMW